MAGGWIKLYRQITTWRWYRDANTFRVFLHLLITANSSPRAWRDVVIQRGELVTSIRTLQDELNLTEMKVRTALNHLEETGEITIKASKQYSRILINNYEEYQAKAENGEGDIERTSNYKPNETPAYAPEISRQSGKNGEGYRTDIERISNETQKNIEPISNETQKSIEPDIERISNAGANEVPANRPEIRECGGRNNEEVSNEISNGSELMPGKTSNEYRTELENLSTNKKTRREEVKKTRSNEDTGTAEPAIDYKSIVDLFNEKRGKLPKVQILTDARRAAIKARWNNAGAEPMQFFENLFSIAGGSAFLAGANDRDWIADFDWLMKEQNAAKVLEGRYSQKRFAAGEPVKKTAAEMLADRNAAILERMKMQVANEEGGLTDAYKQTDNRNIGSNQFMLSGKVSDNR